MILKNEYEIRGDKAIIYVQSKGVIYECEIHKDRLGRAMEFPNKWYAHKHRNTIYVEGIAAINGKKKTYKFHRWLLQPPSDKVIDHIDGNGLNNLDENLRVCSAKENGQNIHYTSNNDLPRGVKNHNGRFRAVMVMNKEKFHIGVFDTVDEADKAVKYFRSKYMPYSLEAHSHASVEFDRDKLVEELKKFRESRSKGTSSKYVGVYRMKDGRWAAQYKIKGVRDTKYIGGFNNELVASIIRDIEVYNRYGLNSGYNFNHPTLFTESGIDYDVLRQFDIPDADLQLA